MRDDQRHMDEDGEHDISTTAVFGSDSEADGEITTVAHIRNAQQYFLMRFEVSWYLKTVLGVQQDFLSAQQYYLNAQQYFFWAQQYFRSA